MPVDPLGKVTIIPRGVDPERRPTAPPPKRGSGAVASPAPARPPKPNLRPTPEVAAKAAEIRAKAPVRTADDIERDRRIRELRDKARGRGTREERADAAYRARLAEREAQSAAPSPQPDAAVVPKSNGTPEQREAWRQRLSIAMKGSWEKRRQARAALGEKLLQKVEAVPAAEAKVLTQEPCQLGCLHEVGATDNSPEPTPAAPERAEFVMQAAFLGGVAAGDVRVVVSERRSPPIPEGAHVVVERLDARVGEVALELDFEEAFGFRVARSHEGADPSAPACATILCHGKLQAEPVGIVDPDRARAIGARLIAAADLAEALLRTPNDQLAAFILRGMED